MVRLVITGNARGISIDNLMQYSLGPVPMSLAYPDGSLMKTNRAKLLHYLEETVPNSKVENVPHGSAWIIDAMEIIQKIPVGEVPKTFGGLANLYLEKVFSIARKNKAAEVHVVPDRYPEVSIKNAERARRRRSVQESTMTINVYSEEQKTTIQ